ncbi:hypothetical protein BpHYR1_008966 [Brachionus plicatilis]|uniref:Uncharacterized protein n=1 Tax=Brachionus plicatilis TaxID=10195 RepID=A0A3M7Q1N2_BRAPC|nr:hypothetical protein BpHYR1_008966 [Brachionus plicatilis]
MRRQKVWVFFLDIFLIPSSLSDRVYDFKFLIDDDMLRNHFPIQAFISVEHTITRIGDSTKIYLSLQVNTIVIRKILTRTKENEKISKNQDVLL